MSPQTGAGHGGVICDGRCALHDRGCVIGAHEPMVAHGCAKCQRGEFRVDYADGLGGKGSTVLTGPDAIAAADEAGASYSITGTRVENPDGSVTFIGPEAPSAVIDEAARRYDGLFPGERPEEIAKMRAALEASKRVGDTATRPRVAVGGSLHGRVLLVPVTATAVYSDHGMTFEVRESDGGPLAPDGVTFRAVARFEVYQVRDVGRTASGNVGLVIAAELLKSSGTASAKGGVDETIVEALGIAAGVHGRSRTLSQ